MVVLNRIYTRTGDDGTTALANGERRKKYDARIAAYGTVDETNATIGLARLHTSERPRLDAMLARIQNDLFDLGADLCLPGQERLRVSEAQVARLEQEIDLLNQDLAPLTSFVLPGGSSAAACLHLARTVSRRAERLIVELAETTGETVSPPVLKYMNRLSDFLFVAARWANDEGARDVLWVPGQNL
jgi:cob(I)alamin adenosyltransferase